MIGLTTEFPSVHSMLSNYLTACHELHKKDPAVIELGKEEYYSFKMEHDSTRDEFKGIPVICIPGAGVTMRLSLTRPS
jgi:hypothetical protein